MYGLAGCPFCTELKLYLRQHGIRFKWIAVEDCEERNRLYAEVRRLTADDRPCPSFSSWACGLVAAVRPRASRSLIGASC
jgi:hypothetical protein